MADINVKTVKLKASALDLIGISLKVNTYADELRTLRSQLEVSGSAETEIKSKLLSIINSLEKSKTSIKDMGSTLEEIASQYNKTERELAGVSEFGSKILDALDITGIIFNNIVTWGDKTVVKSGKIFGIDVEGEYSRDLFGASGDAGFEGPKFKWSSEKNDDGKLTKTFKLDDITLISAFAKGEAFLFSEKAKGKIGILSGEIEGKVGKVSGKGEVKATLFSKGKFEPKISAEAKAEATALEGKAEGQLGSDNNNLHAKAEGKLGTASAKAGAAVGKVSVTKADGTEVKGYGVKAEAGAEAYAAEGKVSGGVEIFGIKIDATLTGKAGGAGAKAGAGATTGGVGASVALGAGLGLGLDISIDWSDFKIGW